MWKPPSVVPAYLNITDIAGLVRGAAEGAGLGNAFLSHIQAIDGIFHMVRAFDDADIVHVDDSVDPIRDVETITSELCKKDLEELDRAVNAEKLAVRKSGGALKLTQLFTDTMERVKTLLEANKPIRSELWTPGEVSLIRDHLHRLITTKSMVYVVNLSMADYIRKKNKWLPKLHAWIQEHGGGTMIPVSVDYEQKLWALRDDKAAETAFLAEASGAKSALPKLIATGFSELNLINFFTAGEPEVRCWTVYKGALAPQAAGVIHSDFERGFIKAEVVAYEDFKALQKTKGMAEVKAAGKYRQEGKNYVMNDGDIVHFQFNVTTEKKK
jgi:obg-like ATPase 1